MESDLSRRTSRLFENAASVLALCVCAVACVACSSIYVPPPRVDGSTPTMDGDVGGDGGIAIDAHLDVGVSVDANGDGGGMDLGPVDAGPRPDAGGIDGGSVDGGAFCSGANAGDVVGGGDLAVIGSCTPVAWDAQDAPRPIRPLSSTVVTTQRPVFRWQRAMGATDTTLEIASSRADLEAHTLELTAHITSGTSYTPSCPLRPGVHFWRVSSVGHSSAIWEVHIPARSAAYDTSFGNAPRDINGDGYSDVVVGSRESGASVYMGAPTGLATEMRLAPRAGLAGYHFGAALTLTDVNGDSFADVVVGAESSTGGRVFVYRGPDLLATAPQEISPPTARTTADDRVYFGSFVSPAGDVNGDGRGDVVVCTYGDAYIFQGGSSGLSATYSTYMEHAIDTGYNLHPVVGDFNGDGYSDVGLPQDNVIRVYYGSSGGLESFPSTTVNDRGYGSAANDVNGDGYADIIAAFGVGYGSLNVYLGGRDGVAERSETFSVTSPTFPLELSDFGLQSSMPGDLNGDGYPEVVVADCNKGASALHTGECSAVGGVGGVSIYMGTGCGFNATPVLLAYPGSGAHHFGIDVGAAGDTNGDGLADVLVSTSNMYVYRYVGSATSAVDGSPASTLRGSSTAWGAYVASQ
jgi:hypothetical protein